MLSDTKPAVLVTGGAGYIGAHVAKALHDRGVTPVTFDNLSAGFRQAVRWGPLVEGDIRDGAAIRRALADAKATAVIHLAGLIEVGRSFAEPELFREVNVGGTATLLAAMQAEGVQRLVFSSSAAVYGHGGRDPLDALTESAPKAPSSPYGETKLAGEQIIADACQAYRLTAVALRYFNAAGADPSGLIGEAHAPESHLIPLAIAAALGDGPPLTLFGRDFDTPDGTCLRDYVHVTDLAQAHVAALDADLSAGVFEAVNVGAGEGHSVFDVIQAVGAAVGRAVPWAPGDRRAGDPPSLVANPARAGALLRWTPRHSSLSVVVADAVRWERTPTYGRGVRANRQPSL